MHSFRKNSLISETCQIEHTKHKNETGLDFAISKARQYHEEHSSKPVKRHFQLIVGQKDPVETASWKSSLSLSPWSQITLTDYPF